MRKASYMIMSIQNWPRKNTMWIVSIYIRRYYFDWFYFTGNVEKQKVAN